MKKIEFSVYPLMAYPLRGFFSFLIILVITILSYVFIQHIVMPIVAFLILSMPIVNFIIPTKYVLSEICFIKEQLFQPKAINWDKFNSYMVMDDGILLINNKSRRLNEYVYVFEKKYFEEIQELLATLGINKYENK